MKKIKILLFITSSIAILYLVHFFISTLILDTYQYYKHGGVSKQFHFYFNYVLEFTIVISLILVSLGLKKILKSGLFNSFSPGYFKIGGFLLISVAVLDIIYSINSIIVINDSEIFWIQRFFTNSILLILGLVCLISADILSKSSFIKSENDLTI